MQTNNSEIQSLVGAGVVVVVVLVLEIIFECLPYSLSYLYENFTKHTQYDIDYTVCCRALIASAICTIFYRFTEEKGSNLKTT